MDRRICDALQIDPALAEPTQAQHYDVGDEFKAHTGGATRFPNVGLTVQPRTGTAVMWNSLRPDGTPNPRSIHHGMPVTAGWKAIITKWFRASRSGASP